MTRDMSLEMAQHLAGGGAGLVKGLGVAKDITIDAGKRAVTDTALVTGWQEGAKHAREHGMNERVGRINAALEAAGEFLFPLSSQEKRMHGMESTTVTNLARRAGDLASIAIPIGLWATGAGPAALLWKPALNLGLNFTHLVAENVSYYVLNHRRHNYPAPATIPAAT